LRTAASPVTDSAVNHWRLLILATAIGCTAKSTSVSVDSVHSVSVNSVHPVLSTSVFPEAHWQDVASPEAEGYSSPKLDTVRVFLRDLDTTAAIVIVHGRVLLRYGDDTRVSYIASARKSVLGMLFGAHVARGEIKEAATLEDLGIDDIGGLSAQERQATVADLLASRSGVYHPASNPGDDSKDAPTRGSKPHGSWFLYNNWDFNVLGTIFERQTNQSVYDALDRELAQPIGMEDFKRGDQVKGGDSSVSAHLAYPMYLSTRDMARVGYLMLRGGSWRGRELVPKDWVTKLITPTSSAEEVHGYAKYASGYGRLWWLFDDPPSRAGGPLHGAYSAIGAYGQYITVIPQLDMVVAHKVVRKTKEAVSSSDYHRLLDMIIATRE
jgi:CubicO group peptidase (beta-lactamase class C family)